MMKTIAQWALLGVCMTFAFVLAVALLAIDLLG